jgi:phosphonate transport system substrate-binding protein
MIRNKHIYIFNIGHFLRRLGRTTLALFVFISLISSQHALAADSRELTFGIHPYLPATKLLKKFTPLAEQLFQETGYRIRIVISNDYSQHIKTIANGNFDFAYLGPAPYVYLTQKHSAPLLAKLAVHGEGHFHGVIAVPEGSQLKSMKELEGKRFAFGDPKSTMSHLVPLYMLNNADIALDKLATTAFLGSHQNVALGVLMGDFDAGGLKEETFNKMKSRGLRSLALSPPVAEHLFVVRVGLPEKVLDTLRQAMLRMSDSEDGREALRSIKTTITALIPVTDSDYDPLRKILQTVESLGKINE